MTFWPGEPLISLDKSGNPAPFVSVDGIPIVATGTSVPMVGGEFVVFPNGTNGYDDLGTSQSHPANGVSSQVGSVTVIASDGVTQSAPAVIPVYARGKNPVVTAPSGAISKAAVLDLRTRVRPNGVMNQTSLTPITSLTIPGVRITADEVIIQGTNITLDGAAYGGTGIDLLGRGLTVTGHAAMVRNIYTKSVLGGPAPLYMGRIATGGYLENIEYCEFEGAAGYGGLATCFVAQLPSGNIAGPNVPYGRLGRMYRCRFTKFRQDGPKLTSGVAEECYLGPPYGLPYASRGIYSPTTTYVGGDYVLAKLGICYTPRVTGPNYVPGVGIVGVHVPGYPGPSYSKVTTDPNWQLIDPHGDGWTMLAGFGGIKWLNTLWDWGDPPSPGEELGLNNAWRILRNNGTAPLVEKIEMIGCVFYYKATSAYPIQFGGGTTPPGLPARSYLNGPFEIVDCHLSANGQGKYVHPTGADIPTRWVNVKDATTGVAVPPPNNTASTV